MSYRVRVIGLVARVVETVSRNEAICIGAIVVGAGLAIWWSWKRMDDN